MYVSSITTFPAFSYFIFATFLFVVFFFGFFWLPRSCWFTIRCLPACSIVLWGLGLSLFYNLVLNFYSSQLLKESPLSVVGKSWHSSFTLRIILWECSWYILLVYRCFWYPRWIKQWLVPFMIIQLWQNLCLLFKWTTTVMRPRSRWLCCSIGTCVCSKEWSHAWFMDMFPCLLSLQIFLAFKIVFKWLESLLSLVDQVQ